MRKKVVISLIFIILLMAITSLANTQVRFSISSDISELKGGQEATIIVRLESYEGIKEGINCYKATLDYDMGVFEEVSEKNFKCENDWDQEHLKYNKDTKEFIAIKKAGAKETEDILHITLKAKKDAKALPKTEVKIKDIVTSEGKNDIQLDEVKLEFGIIEDQQEVPEIPDKITSEKYHIDNDIIEYILPNTTVADFIQNIETNSELEFKNLNDAQLKENELISTGCQLKVGKTLNYTLIVLGDINQDGKLSLTDVAQAKLHYIGKNILTEHRLRAADVNKSGTFGLTDIAQLKLIFIGKRELK